MTSLWRPHDYQEQAVEFLIERLIGQLWLTPGLGKTTVALEAFKRLCAAGHAKRMLVVAPLRVAQVTWTSEASKWSNFSHFSVGVLHGAQKEAVWARAPQIAVINYEGLEWLESRLLPGMFDVLVFDEISKLKNCTTKRFETVRKFNRRIPMRWGLTGSPASNHLMNVFGPQLVIDNGATFGTNYWKFREDHFYPPRYSGSLQWEMDLKKRYTWEPKPDNVVLNRINPYSWHYELSNTPTPGGRALIYEKMKGKALAMNAIDHLQMPKLVTNDIYVPLPSKLEKLYRELEKPWLHEIEEANFAVHGNIATQFTSGSLYIPTNTDSYFYTFLEQNPGIRDALLKQEKRVVKSGRQYWYLHSLKVERAQELVDELQGAGALIAYNYEHELHELKIAFPDAPVLSELDGVKLAQVMEQWNAGQLEVLLCQPKSVGHGLNLQGHGQAVIWYSLTWSLEEYEQLIGRIWRQGQRNNTIVVHRILIENSIDCDLLFALDFKNQTQLEVIAQTGGFINETDKTVSFNRALEAAKTARMRASQVGKVKQMRMEFATQAKDGANGVAGEFG